MNRDWQLKTSIDAVLFDCDGTLSRLEGIDELARMNGVGPAVEQLTATAMGQTGINPELYQQRLALVKPSHAQVSQLGEQYFIQRSVDAMEVIQILQALQKQVFIISAGLLPAVSKFGQALNIPADNIFAVEVYFDNAGNYLDFDHHSPLTKSAGKKFIASQIKEKYSRLLHVGDGLNDYSTYDLVTRFVGYGGAFFHKKLAEVCQYYINSPSLTALLPLALTANEVSLLTPTQYALYENGLALINK